VTGGHPILEEEKGSNVSAQRSHGLGASAGRAGSLVSRSEGYWFSAIIGLPISEFGFPNFISFIPHSAFRNPH